MWRHFSSADAFFLSVRMVSTSSLYLHHKPTEHHCHLQTQLQRNSMSPLLLRYSMMATNACTGMLSAWTIKTTHFLLALFNRAVIFKCNNHLGLLNCSFSFTLLVGKPTERCNLRVKGFQSLEDFSASAAVTVGKTTIHRERSNLESFAALFWNRGIKHLWRKRVSCRHTPRTRVFVHLDYALWTSGAREWCLIINETKGIHKERTQACGIHANYI